MMDFSVLKRAYDGIALFCVLNVLVVGGLFVYLVGSGAVDGEKVHRIAAVIRGDQPQADVETATEPPGVGEVVAEPPPDTENTIDSQVELEILRREAERIQSELRQRLALNNSILLRITSERENFRREREAARRLAEAERGERETEGFEKQIAILEGVRPKTAVVHLLALGDPDEAAKILLAMETRKAKKIVEAAKLPNQMEQMKLILRRLRDAAPDRSAELAAK